MLIDGDADGTGAVGVHLLQDLIQMKLASPTELAGSLLTTNTSLPQYPASEISAHVNESKSPPGKFTTNSKSDGTKSTHGTTISTSVTAPTASSYSPFCSASATRFKAKDTSHVATPPDPSEIIMLNS